MVVVVEQHSSSSSIVSQEGPVWGVNVCFNGTGFKRGA
jgi:hypothetical protein